MDRNGQKHAETDIDSQRWAIKNRHRQNDKVWPSLGKFIKGEPSLATLGPV